MTASDSMVVLFAINFCFALVVLLVIMITSVPP